MPIEVTLDGLSNVIVVNFVAALNAPLPIEVTLEGMLYVVASLPKGYFISVLRDSLNKTPSTEVTLD